MPLLRTEESGIALVIALLLAGFFAAIGLGLALTLSVDRLSDRNHAEHVRLLYAADAALELAADALAAAPDFDAVLAGLAASPYVDGPSAAAPILPGGQPLDLLATAAMLTCGRSSGCTAGQRVQATAARPWGANNPAWQPYVHLPFADVAGASGADIYVAVWIGDDEWETDGDPFADGGAADGAGAGMLRAHAEAYGRHGGRRALEADLVRVCGAAGPEGGCLPGIRVQSWREVSGQLP